MKAAWSLARKSFPDKRVFVESLPRVLSRGEAPVRDLETGERLGSVAYEDRGGDLRVSIGPEEMILRKDRKEVSIEASSDTYQIRLGANEEDPVRIVSSSSDPVDLGRRLAMLISTSKDSSEELSDDYVRSWVSRKGFDSSVVALVVDAIKSEAGDRRPFNLKVAKGKNRFDVNDKVRVIYETSMEYQECGRVLEVKGDNKDGYWYSVLVDGSGDPLWFPESSLDNDLSGVIVDPVPEPIQDEDDI